jgi:hypothetical protein
MATFDSYLQQRGFGSGTKLTPTEASAAYTEYQSSLNTPAWSIATAPKQTEQTQSSGGNGGMGAAAGIGMQYAKSAGGSAGSAGGASGGSGGFSGSWAGVPQGALAGWAAGKYKYDNDPKMKSKKDGFGEHYPDYRTQVGGAIGGGALGYYGLGSVAGPVISVAQEGMEPATRWAINFGDSWGGSGGALFMDPIGTVSSGKYSGEELAYGALLGPAAKWFGLT